MSSSIISIPLLPPQVLAVLVVALCVLAVLVVAEEYGKAGVGVLA